MKRRIAIVSILMFLYIVPLFFMPYYSPSTILEQKNTTEDFTLSSEPSWYDSDWHYRKSVNISGSSGAGSDYQVKLTVNYGIADMSLTKVSNFTANAHQGVTVDGTYIYTTNATSISKFNYAGTYQISRDCSNDSSILATTTLGDLCYYNGFLYVAAHNADSSDCTALEYNASDLGFIAEYDLIEPTTTDAIGTAGISYNAGYFWTVSDTQTDDADFQITKYTTSFVYADKWTVDSFSATGTWHYQGLDWYDSNYIIMSLHEDAIPESVDIYYFNGDGFNKFTRITQPYWTADGNNNTASQGIATEQSGDIWYIWFATRNGVDQLNQVGKFTLGFDTSIFCQSNCQTDFDDIRFTEDDGTTELSYYLDSYVASDSATFYVKITDDLDSNQTVYIYYGKYDATTTSSGDNTFLFFDDFEDHTLVKWDTVGSDWSVQGSVVYSGIYSAFGNSGSGRFLLKDVTLNSGSYMTHANFRVIEIGNYYKYGFAMEDNDTHDVAGVIAYANDWIWWNGSPNYWQENTVAANTWYTLDLGFELGGDAYLWIDDSYIGSHPFVCYTNDAVNEVIAIGSATSGSASKDQYLDNYWLQKWVYSEPVVDAVGDQETVLVWQEVDNVNFYIRVPFDYWAVDMVILFAGLAMAIFSTVYAAYKVRTNTLSMTVGFIVIIMFMMGWALFLGQIAYVVT